MPKLFDAWPEEYERWFQTPIGRLVKKFEAELILDLLDPRPGERVLDAGCGTGIFTRDFLARGARAAGLDLSLPMLRGAKIKGDKGFVLVQGDMLGLPFPDGCFDKAVSVTALEFVEDAGRAAGELVRVTKSKGTIVAATLNRLSPWAARREKKGREGHPLFSRVFFRTPRELSALAGGGGTVRSAVHFLKDEDPQRAVQLEEEGRRKNLLTGAFLAVRWQKS